RGWQTTPRRFERGEEGPDLGRIRFAFARRVAEARSGGDRSAEEPASQTRDPIDPAHRANRAVAVFAPEAQSSRPGSGGARERSLDGRIVGLWPRGSGTR